MIRRLSGGTGGGVLNIALQAVVANAAQRNGAALHEEELLAVNTVADRRKHIYRGILDGDILAGLDAVLGVAGDVQCTALRELGMSFDIQTAFLATVSRIDERIGRTVQRFDLDTFAVLDMYRRPRENSRLVRQRQITELHRGFIGAFVVETAVSCTAGEDIGDLCRHIRTLHDAHVCTGSQDRDVRKDIV